MLGKISYSFYLLHQVIEIEILQRIDTDHARWTFFTVLAAGFPVTVLLAAAAYWFVERPFIRRRSSAVFTVGLDLQAERRDDPDPVLEAVAPRAAPLAERRDHDVDTASPKADC